MSVSTLARRGVAAAGAMLLVCVSSACGVWGPEGGPGGSGIAAPAAGRSPAEPAGIAVAGADGVQRVTVVAGDDLRFRPSVVRAKPGVLEVTVRNTGTTPHDMEVRLAPAPGESAVAGRVAVPAGWVAVPAGPVAASTGAVTASTGNLNGGESRSVRVTIGRSGIYPFICLYHVSSGMRGTIEVTT